MKNLFSKIFIACTLMITLFCGGVVFADGAPSYNKNMYAVVVNNEKGAELLEQEWSNEEHKYVFPKAETVPYGTKFIVVETTELNGETYLFVNSDFGFDIEGRRLISSSDVELYGEAVAPSDLRFKS